MCGALFEATLIPNWIYEKTGQTALQKRSGTRSIKTLCG